MGRKRKVRQTGTGAVPATGPAKAAGSVHFSLGKRIAFGLIAALLVFALIEAGLALLGVRPVLYEKDPYVGFAAQIPLFVEGPDGAPQRVTAANKLRLFNRQQFPNQKAAGTYRIFSVGGSTTYGRPYDDSTSFTGWLREYLAAAAPDRHWEVINAGGISYASYRVALLMEELIRYEPDLFIVYSGHNEFLERRTYGEVQDMPRAVRGLGVLAARTRTGGLIQRIIDGARSANSAPASQLDGEVVTLLDHSIGPQAFSRDDRLREQILRHYRFNLARICDIARSVGARVIFVNPASNLADCSPFKSEHRAGLVPAELANWQEAMRAAQQFSSNAPPSEALASLDAGIRIDDRHAQSHFARGRLLARLGRFEDARAAYERARDEDVCPLRALSSMPDIVREVAADRGVPFVDFVALQASRSEHGIPGAGVFFDHVHPTIESHRLLALAILEVMVEQGLVAAMPDVQARDAVSGRVLGSLDAGKNAEALVNLSKVLGWAGKLEEAHRLAVQAAGLAPDSVQAQYQAGLCSQLLGNTDDAITYYRRTVQLDPSAAQAHGNLGVALEDRGLLTGALEQFQLAIQRGGPDDQARNRDNLERVRAKLAGQGQGGR